MQDWKKRDFNEFLIVNDAKKGITLRGDAITFLINEFKLELAGDLDKIYCSDAYNVMELNCAGEPLRFYVTGKTWNDSDTFKAASNLNFPRTVFLQ